ncbi:hypothetical protein PG999_007784 [Apiospora kogelbergensis]|uniref:Uncharacterized protein n=1 Tax=Apiospora kogelbergensis TaxID=1337665 RepID=A0AAW0QM86_9PEZI
MTHSHIIGSGVHAIHAPSRRISNVRSPAATHWNTGRNTYTRSCRDTPRLAAADRSRRRCPETPLPRRDSVAPWPATRAVRKWSRPPPSGTPETSYPPPASSCVAADRDTRRWGLRRARAVASPARD